jgi:DNA polymerase-3 subunit epsilon
VLRDLDILSAMARRNLARVCLSVTTLDPRLARIMEPRAAAPDRRLAAVRQLSENGIPAAVSPLEQPWDAALTCFQAMVAAADGILAHNAAFDRQWFGHGALPALDKPWICSMEDIHWPAERHLRPNPSVRDLALAYEVPVWAAHRALTDCTYLVQVLQRCDGLEDLLVAAQEPRRLYRAQLAYSERHQAKAAGFRWNDPVPGAWSKRLSEREITTLPFPVNPVLSA